MKFLVNLVIHLIILLVIPVNIKKIVIFLINSLMILKIKVYLQTNMLNVEKQINLQFLIIFLMLLSVKMIALFHLLMMGELNSETMILLLSVLISNCNFCNSTVCEDSAINIYHSPSVICHI